MRTVKTFFLKCYLVSTSDVLGKFRKLRRWQWLDKQQTEALQRKRLKDLLLYAYHHVPYYRKLLMDSGVIDTSTRVRLDHFPQVPFLDKNIIQENYDNLKSDDLGTREWYENASGGSTGQPVRFVQDALYAEWRDAAKLLNDLWAGNCIGAGKVKLWGSERDLFEGKEKVIVRIDRWLKNTCWLNAFRMTPGQMHVHVSKINSLKPTLILAYAESIYELSKFIEREGLRVHSPSAIMSSAGNLHAHMRETVERVFRAPIFNRYGSREVGDIACECDHHKGLHVAAPNCYLEILKPNGMAVEPCKIGKIVVTSLTNYAMPLIRYRIGDMGTWVGDLCPCGRGWPLIEKLAGRETDVFFKRNGGVVIPEYLIHLIGVVLNTGWIQKYQVIQEDYDHIRVRIVLTEQVSNPPETYAMETQEITDKIRLLMGQDCKVEYEYLDEIAPTASGKYRYTISKCPTEES